MDVDVLVRIPPDHETGHIHPFRVHLGKHVSLLDLAAVRQPHQAPAVHGQPLFHAGQVQDRRGHVYERDRLRDPGALVLAAGEPHDERHPARPLVEGALLHHPLFAQHVAVIAGKDDDRVLAQARVLQGLQQLPDLVVHVRDQAIVRPPQVVQAVRLPHVHPVDAVKRVQPAVHS